MEKEKSDYSIASNIAFMVKQAWQGNKIVLVVTVLLALLGVGTSLLQLFISPVLLGKIESHVPLGNLLGTIGLFILGLVVFSGLQTYFEHAIFMNRITIRTFILNAINMKVQQTSFPNVSSTSFLEKWERSMVALSNNNSASEKIWATLTAILQNSLNFIIYLGLLATVDGRLILVVIVTALVGFAVTQKVNDWRFQHRQEEDKIIKKIDYLDKKATDATPAKDIRLFHMKNWLLDVYQEGMTDLNLFLKKRERHLFIGSGTDILMNFLRNGFAYAYLIYFTLQNNLSAAEFLLYFSTVTSFSQGLTIILTEFNTLKKQSIDLSRTREFIDMPETFKFTDGKALEPSLDKTYELRLDHVSFHYPESKENILDAIDLTIRPGEKLAIVGLNGAGKTTLVKLLCGFLDPTDGRVLLNGQDIRQYDRRDYYRHFSALFQDFSILETDVLENITQTLDAPADKRVEQILEQVGLTEKIKQLPQGVHTHIGRNIYEDGVELSGGQMQRLLLARALYKNAPIVVLDEPTAALDPIAENDIYQRYNDLTKGRTSLFISHRLASTRFCDRIIYLAAGKIVETGTHQELLAKKGQYAYLFEVQSKYYREGDETDGTNVAQTSLAAE